MVVIESDDGTRGDYTHWYPTLIDAAHKHSSWANSRLVVACPALNTGDIGGPFRMSWAEVQELCKAGWEMTSHGRTHTGLGRHHLTVAAPAGATSITTAGELGNLGGYEYVITNGVDAELVRVASRNGSTANLAAPLAKAWGTDAYIQLSSDGLTELLQGAIDDMAAQGIDCKHHTYTYHYGSEHYHNPDAIARVGELFQTGRGAQGDTNTPARDRRNLRSRLLNDALALETIDSILDSVAANDNVAIFYGHGEPHELRLTQLQRIVDGCVARRIRIGTRSEAAEKLYGQQAI